MKRLRKKRILAVFTALLLILLSACGTGEPAPERTEVVVFAAASLTETLEQLKPLYEAEHNVNLVFSFESSGTLKEQIMQGAPCDLFLSAGQKQMDQLEEENLIRTESRVNLLENKVTLCVPESNPKGIDSFETLAQALRSGGILMAMGNSDVPVGQYTQKILDYYDLSEAELSTAGAITYGSNVKEVTTWISEGSVDCGVIYCTDAFSAGLEVVDEATAGMCGQVIYPAAVTAASAHPEQAQAFLDYLQSDEAMEVFTAVGFSPVD